MATQVRCNDVPVVAQFLSYPVPTARMVAAAMDQKQGRRIGISPNDIVQPKALLNKAVGDGAM